MRVTLTDNHYKGAIQFRWIVCRLLHTHIKWGSFGVPLFCYSVQWMDGASEDSTMNAIRQRHSLTRCDVQGYVIFTETFSRPAGRGV